MTHSDTAIHSIGEMISAQLLTDAKARTSSESTAFACGPDDFEVLVMRAAHAAFRLIPYGKILDIALAMQRQELLAAGIPMLSKYLDEPQQERMAS